MKRLLLALLFLTPVLASAQADYGPEYYEPRKKKDKKVIVLQDSVFEFRVVDSVSATKSELFTRARVWVANAFKDSKNVVQVEDREAGKIVGKGVFLVSPYYFLAAACAGDQVDFTFTIDVKDGKFRCVMSDFSHQGCTSYKSSGVTHWPSGGPMRQIDLREYRWDLNAKRWQELRREAKAKAGALLASFDSEMKRAQSVTPVNDGY